MINICAYLSKELVKAITTDDEAAVKTYITDPTSSISQSFVSRACAVSYAAYTGKTRALSAAVAAEETAQSAGVPGADAMCVLNTIVPEIHRSTRMRPKFSSDDVLMPSGSSPLMLAARTGRARTVLALLNHPAGDTIDMLWLEDVHGRIALEHGIASGRVDVVRTILNHPGAHAERMLQHTDIDGVSVLSRAASAGFAPVIDALLTHNAALDIMGDMLGVEQLVMAASNGHLNAMATLMKHKDDDAFLLRDRSVGGGSSGSSGSSGSGSSSSGSSSGIDMDVGGEDDESCPLKAAARFSRLNFEFKPLLFLLERLHAVTKLEVDEAGAEVSGDWDGAYHARQARVRRMILLAQEWTVSDRICGECDEYDACIRLMAEIGSM